MEAQNKKKKKNIWGHNSKGHEEARNFCVIQSSILLLGGKKLGD